MSDTTSLDALLLAVATDMIAIDNHMVGLDETNKALDRNANAAPVLAAIVRVLMNAMIDVTWCPYVEDERFVHGDKARDAIAEAEAIAKQNAPK